MFASNWDHNQDDRAMLKDFIPVLNSADESVAHFGCLTPGHKVLTSDLRWVPIETLQIGDELLAVDQSESRTSYRRFRYSKSIVTHASPIQKEVFRITLSGGKTLIASEDHPWLVKRGGLRLSGKHTWRKTSELSHFNCKTPTMMQILPVWETLQSKEAGYIAGFIDSEGSIIQGRKTGRDDYGFSISASQHSVKNNDVLTKACSCLDALGWKYTVRSYDSMNRDQKVVKILGTKATKLSFLGQVRPAKINRIDLSKLGTLQEHQSQDIVKIEPLGVQTVIGLSTSTQTYISEGFVCHNSAFDLPWIKARCLHHNIRTLPTYKIIDTKTLAAKHFLFNSNKLDYLARYLGIGCKLHTDYDLWKRIVLDKDPIALRYMVKYNKGDVRLLEQVYDRLQEAVPHHTHVGVLNGKEKYTCPKCGSDKVKTSKTTVTAKGVKQFQMQCRVAACGAYYSISQCVHDKYLERR